MKNIPDGVTALARFSEHIESVFQFPDHLLSMDAARTLFLNGKLSLGDGIHLSLAVNRGPMAISSAPTAATLANSDQAKASHCHD